jgi:uncharacterized protein YidB (DUF937 family)
MGLLDSVVGALARGQGQGGGQGDLLAAVVGMLANQAGSGGGAGGVGGVGDLIGRFQRGGLGDVIGSWIGTGQNLPISPDQLSQVLGSDVIGQIARQVGLAPGDAAGQLSQLLPQVLDQLTPQGQVPEDGLGDMGDLLGRLMQR